VIPGDCEVRVAPDATRVAMLAVATVPPRSRFGAVQAGTETSVDSPLNSFASCLAPDMSWDTDIQSRWTFISP
jgi:hypothetical protein